MISVTGVLTAETVVCAVATLALVLTATGVEVDMVVVMADLRADGVFGLAEERGVWAEGRGVDAMRDNTGVRLGVRAAAAAAAPPPRGVSIATEPPRGVIVVIIVIVVGVDATRDNGGRADVTGVVPIAVCVCFNAKCDAKMGSLPASSRFLTGGLISWSSAPSTATVECVVVVVVAAVVAMAGVGVVVARLALEGLRANEACAIAAPDSMGILARLLDRKFSVVVVVTSHSNTHTFIHA